MVREGEKIVYKNRLYDVAGAHPGESLVIEEKGNFLEIYKEGKLLKRAVVKTPVEERSLEDYQLLVGGEEK